MSDYRIVLTVRCAKCRKSRGYVITHGSDRLWAWPAVRRGHDSAAIRHSRLHVDAEVGGSVPPRVADVVADITATTEAGDIKIAPLQMSLAPCRCTSTSAPIDSDQIRDYLRGVARVVSVAPVSRSSL